MELLICYDSLKNVNIDRKKLLKVSIVSTQIMKMLIYCGNVINKQNITSTSGTNIRMSSVHQSNDKSSRDIGLKKISLSELQHSFHFQNFLLEWKFHSKFSNVLHDFLYICVCRLYNTVRDVGNCNLFKEEKTMHISYNVLYVTPN
jgi:hypothetical protein